MIKFSNILFAIAITSVNVFTAAQAAPSTDASASDSAQIEILKKQVADIAKARQTEKANLANFDDLDFNVYTGQKWDQLKKSHAENIIVHYPDSHISKGISAHVDELKGMFVFAPDNRIKEHPIRIASGEWTAVMGRVEGTFTQPMPIGDGKTLPPTGKAYKLDMITIGHWTKEGVMDEEWLVWDNQAFLKQIGLAQ